MLAMLSVAAALAGASPTLANGVLTMSPGDTVVIRLGPGGPVIADDSVVTKKDHRPWGDGVRLKFQAMGERQMMLTVENGYGDLRTAYRESRYIDGSVFADITPAVRAGLSYQYSEQTFADDVTADNRRIKLSLYCFF